MQRILGGMIISKAIITVNKQKLTTQEVEAS
jgi:hypothetical protein